MEQIYDLVILGSGPAGLGASIYAQRAELKTLVIEKEMVSGGQVLTTYEVDNYAGLPGINGFDLGMKFREHADRLGAEFAEDSIIGIQQAGEDGEGLLRAAEAGDGGPVLWKLNGENGTYLARTVIIATGARHRKLEVPGEERLMGMGVSYCATCDGAFFKKKTAAVVGGGDVAIEDAIFLARICEKVYLIHRRNELRGAKSLQKKLMEMENVEILWDTVTDSINGENKVESLSLTNKKTGEKWTAYSLPWGSLPIQRAWRTWWPWTEAIISWRERMEKHPGQGSLRPETCARRTCARSLQPWLTEPTV